MRFKMQATVVYEWEEDSDNWDDRPEADIRKLAKDYIKGDPSYILDGPIKSIIIDGEVISYD